MTSAARPLAVVTGASSGIGATLAPLLAREGYDLLLVARREALLADLAAKIRAEVPGAIADPFALDVTEAGAVPRLLERAAGARLVVNSAGVGRVGPALADDFDVYRRMIALNVTALTEITHAFARRMAERTDGGGTIFNIASTAAFQPMPYFAVYAATKAYVVSMSEALHYEVRKSGVKVLAFCPGPTATEFSVAAGAAAEQVAEAQRFFQSPEKVAAVALRAIKRSKERGIPGFVNRFAAVLARHAPRRMVRWSAAAFFAPKPPAEG